MDQQKIGEFLKTLRKEKDLTQEELADKMNVSRRTVSRWETGSNLPDLSILVELADLYDVDLREIFDGERKSETMDKDLKETMLKAADYTDDQIKELFSKINSEGCGYVAMVNAIFVQYHGDADAFERDLHHHPPVRAKLEERLEPPQTTWKGCALSDEADCEAEFDSERTEMPCQRFGNPLLFLPRGYRTG